jgi:hypothetical protein
MLNKIFRLRTVIIALLFPLAYFLGVPLWVNTIYSPREGDIVFQSLSRSSDLVRAIEGITNSPYSHCGMVVQDEGHWFVYEALGKVRKTPLWDFISRGRGCRMDVFRFKASFNSDIPEIVKRLDHYKNLPYDAKYKMDDQNIYCSELVYKAHHLATGRTLGELDKLGELNWEPYVKTIEKYERGPVPLDREMITPVGMSQSEELEFTGGYGWFLW